MKKIICIIFLGIMLGFVSAHSVRCEVTYVEGVAVDEFGMPANIERMTPLGNAPNSLDFSHPCLFIDALPAAKNNTFYKHLGFSFKGNGAVLNKCESWWGVTGNSSADFLAFNCYATLYNGKVPSLPERITFKPPVSSVSFRIGSHSSAGELVQIAINKKAFSYNVVLENTMPEQRISSPSLIKTLDISVPEGSNACVVVIDDIKTTP